MRGPIAIALLLAGCDLRFGALAQETDIALDGGISIDFDGPIIDPPDAPQEGGGVDAPVPIDAPTEGGGLDAPEPIDAPTEGGGPDADLTPDAGVDLPDAPTAPIDAPPGAQPDAANETSDAGTSIDAPGLNPIDDDGRFGETSFYACSSSSTTPLAAFPLALAIAFALRRRRR